MTIQVLTATPATRDDVVRAYRLILNREPESEFAINSNLEDFPSIWDLIERFMNSPEKKQNDRAGHAFSAHKCNIYPYLALNINNSVGIQCYLHNLDYLHKTVKHENLIEIFYNDIEIERFSIDDMLYTITVQFSREVVNEGELSLYFRENGEPLYILSFSFAPKAALPQAGGDFLLITRMQGFKGKREQIGRATKAAGEVSPQAYLFAVAQGIAKAARLDELYGVAALNQVCHEERYQDLMERSYDHFFSAYDLEGPAGGFYRAQLPLRHKPLREVTRWHRLRAIARRRTRGNAVNVAHDRWLMLMREDRRPAPSIWALGLSRGRRPRESPSLKRV